MNDRSEHPDHSGPEKQSLVRSQVPPLSGSYAVRLAAGAA